MCGCGGGGAVAAYPMTSGDLVAGGNGPDRFKVVSKTEVDPETGAALELSRHSDYRLASIEASRVGGKIRTIST